MAGGLIELAELDVRRAPVIGDRASSWMVCAKSPNVMELDRLEVVEGPMVVAV